MSCNVQVQKNYDAPALAGTFRFLLGLGLFFAGLYIALFSGIQGHGLGLVVSFGSAFVMFTNEK